MPKPKPKSKKAKIVSHKEWLSARKAFLAKEKKFTKLRDELNRQRRELPWEKVEKDYVFESPQGRQSLAQLFGSKSQLVIYHFMFAPNWDEGCPHCSFWADNFNPIPVFLQQRDISFAAVSRAPLSKISAFQKRMGWSFPWVSSGESDFNYDYQTSFRPADIKRKAVYYNFETVNMDMSDREGVSVFIKDSKGAIYHSYSSYARGIDLLNTAYNYIDLTPKGRNEGNSGQSWVDYRDKLVSG